MSEPEISRRCHACGASIRDRAAFCPQCGIELKTIAEEESGSPGGTASTVVEPAPQPSVSNRQKREDPVAVASDQSSRVNTSLAQPKPASSQAASRPGQKPAGTPGAHIIDEARDKVKRATGIARNVGGDVVHRGQKLREMSSVVLDEASYDPSLRFVLVAAVLFFLFLIIVLLSRFIG